MPRTVHRGPIIEVIAQHPDFDPVKVEATALDYIDPMEQVNVTWYPTGPQAKRIGQSFDKRSTVRFARPYGDCLIAHTACDVLHNIKQDHTRVIVVADPTGVFL